MSPDAGSQAASHASASKPGGSKPAQTHVRSRRSRVDVKNRGMPLCCVPDEIDADESAQAGDRLDRPYDLWDGIRTRSGNVPPDTQTGPRGSPSAGFPRRSARSAPLSTRKLALIGVPERTAGARRLASRAHGGQALGIGQEKSVHRAGSVQGLQDSRILCVNRQPGSRRRSSGSAACRSRVPRSRTVRRALSAASSTASAVEPSNRAPGLLELAGEAGENSARLGGDQHGKIGGTSEIS